MAILTGPPLDEMPDLVAFLAGPFFRGVNATATYVAAYAAASLAAILADSTLLVLLKHALMFAFLARAMHLAVDGARLWPLGLARLLGAGALAMTATIAAHAATEAALVQLDDTRTARALRILEIRRAFGRVGMHYQCWDINMAEAPTCTALRRAQIAAEQAVTSPAPARSPAARTTETPPRAAPASR